MIIPLMSTVTVHGVARSSHRRMGASSESSMPLCARPSASIGSLGGSELLTSSPGTLTMLNGWGPRKTKPRRTARPAAAQSSARWGPASRPSRHA